jgi:hypothetical protein
MGYEHDEETLVFGAAGQAVIARVLNVEVTDVTFLPGDKIFVRAREAFWLARESGGDIAAIMRGLEADARIALAFLRAADLRRELLNDRPVTLGGEDPNLERARECAAYLAWLQDRATLISEETALSAEQQAEAARIQQRLWSETKALVDQHWPAIELAVQALRQRQVLYGDEIDALLRQASRKDHPHGP